MIFANIIPFAFGFISAAILHNRLYIKKPGKSPVVLFLMWLGLSAVIFMIAVIVIGGISSDYWKNIITLILTGMVGYASICAFSLLINFLINIHKLHE